MDRLHRRRQGTEVDDGNEIEDLGIVRHNSAYRVASRPPLKASANAGETEVILHRLRLPLLLFALLAFLLAPLAFPRIGSSHEPITTNVRFNKEVIRILQRSCLECHAAGKIKADIPLGTYEEARPWAKAIKEEVLEKRMPPYQAVRGFGSFHNNYGLSQREIDLIVSWVEGGAPKGDLKELPASNMPPAWELGKPNQILAPSRDVRVGASEKSRKCFILPTGFKEEKWLSGIEFKPGNERVVHSATISLVPNTAKAVAGGACTPVATRGQQPLSSWVPGQNSSLLPSGVARLIPVRSQILLQISYQGDEQAAVDRSSVGLFFATEDPSRGLSAISISAPATSLPPASEQVKVTSTYTLTAPAEAVALRPLLSPLARSIEAVAYRPDGTVEVLVWAKERRFDWAPTYVFKTPVMLPQGTRIEVVAYFDNSDRNPNNPNDPPKAVRVSDPLCEFFISQPIASRATVSN
jgi:hypothetical protein